MNGSDFDAHQPKHYGGSTVLDLYKKRNYPVIKRNDLIQNTRYRLTLNEQKFILHMIQLITNKTNELKPITISFKQYAKFLGMKPYRVTIHRLKKDLTKLNSKQFWLSHVVNGHHEEDLIVWFTRATIHDDNNTLTVQFNPQLKPYLLQTKKFFTQYNYYYIMTMKSTYSIQLYEYFMSFYSKQHNLRGLNYSLKQIRYHLDIKEGSSYSKYGNMNHRILQPAVKEINELTNVNIRIKPVKNGHKVVGVNVLLKKKHGDELRRSKDAVQKRLEKKSK